MANANQQSDQEIPTERSSVDGVDPVVVQLQMRLAERVRPHLQPLLNLSSVGVSGDLPQTFVDRLADDEALCLVRAWTETLVAAAMDSDGVLTSILNQHLLPEDFSTAHTVFALGIGQFTSLDAALTALTELGDELPFETELPRELIAVLVLRGVNCAGAFNCV